MSENHGRFDAGRTEPTGPSLGAVVRADAEDRVLRRLSRISERIHRDRERDDEPLDPEIIDRLETLCADEDAPLEFRSLARRVHEGRLTWKQFWDMSMDSFSGRTMVHDYQLTTIGNVLAVTGTAAVVAGVVLAVRQGLVREEPVAGIDRQPFRCAARRC